MNTLVKLFLALVLAAGALASAPALAHGRVHFGFGVGFGGPGWYRAPWYYAPPPVYYYPAPVIVQQGPTYIERPAQAPQAAVAPQTSPQTATDSSWYYCRDAQAYYPYVATCPSPWQRVAPQPGS